MRQKFAKDLVPGDVYAYDNSRDNFWCSYFGIILACVRNDLGDIVTITVLESVIIDRGLSRVSVRRLHNGADMQWDILSL